MKNGSFERSLQPIVLSVTAIAIGIAIGVAINFVAFVLYAVMLLVPLFFLWLARDTPSHEERVAALDAERAAAARRPAPSPAPAQGRAA
jgi:hypothetical protein